MLHIDGIIFSIQRSGGISVYFDELIKKLITGNVSFTLSLYDNHSRNDNFSANLIGFVGLVRKMSTRYFERYLDVKVPDDTTVFHSSYYRLPVRRQRRNIKIVTTVHDFTYEKYGSGLSRLIHCYQKKRAILNSDVIICISENTKHDLLKLIPESQDKKIKVVYNGVSSHFTNDSSLSVTSSILFIGARAGYKNFNSVVKATSATELNLVIVGGGNLTGEEHRLLHNHLPNRFSILGFVTENDLAHIYKTSFCLVYPSLYEGFGIPVIEAMKSGCPVIASNSSSLPEVCGGAALLVAEPNADALAKAIGRLSDKYFRSELIEKGLKNAQKFSWEKTFDRTFEIYRE